MSGQTVGDRRAGPIRPPVEPDRWRNAANFAFYQAGWLACVGGAARGWAWGGPAMAAGFLSAQFVLVSARPAAEARFALAAAAAGVGVEALNRAVGVYAMARPELSGPSAAWAGGMWAAALWAGLATTIPGCLAWIGRSPVWVAVGAGAVAGPLAFYSGSRLGAVAMGNPLLWVPALAVEWAVALPLMFAIWKRRTPRLPVFAPSR